MFYRKNLPGWERGARLIGAALMGLCAAWYVSTPAGWALGILGVVSATTEVIGYCPMCAPGSRRLSIRKSRQGGMLWG
jgi:hypothetical protein